MNEAKEPMTKNAPEAAADELRRLRLENVSLRRAYDSARLEMDARVLELEAQLEAVGAECGNCFEGKSDKEHVCRKCGGTGNTQPAQCPHQIAEDAMRLDWLEADAGKCVFHLGHAWYTRTSYGLPYRKQKSLRAAIDTARAAQGGA